VCVPLSNDGDEDRSGDGAAGAAGRVKDWKSALYILMVVIGIGAAVLLAMR